MKGNLRFLAGAFLLTATALFTGCNSDDDFLMNPQTDSVTPETRANFNDDGTTTITFDDFDETFMAVSPKAENYYTLYGYTAENQIREIYDPDFVFVSDMNTVTNSYGAYTEFSSGAIALSKYNYRSDSAAGKTSGTNWWYTWENQCSVYNTASTDGANTGAGHSGSNFAVVYGYSDFGNTEWMAKPEFYFDSPRKFKGLWYCNTAYTYGVIINGNQFGTSGVATPLSNLKDSDGNNIGYFQVNIECYDVDGNLITTVSKLLADYRYDKPTVSPVTTWTYWDINVADVQSVKFNFEGSDVDPIYGLNTPAYLCIDDVTIE